MDKVRFSIAMCTYNGSRYVREQLRSIAAQDHLPYEMIVCDDGSADNTVPLLMEFASQAPFPVHVQVNEERLGPAGNFEKAIGFCQGDIIALADQDDVWKPHKLGTLLEVFERHPNAVYAFSDAEVIDGEGKALGVSLWDAFNIRKEVNRFETRGQLEVLLKRNLVTGAALAFRASLCSTLLPIPSDWMHDYWIALLGSSFSQGVPIREPLIMYRRHDKQVCFRKKTLGQWYLQMIRESLSTGGEDLSKKEERFWQLQERVASGSLSIHCPRECLELVRQKATHLARRAQLRSSRGLPRIVGVLAEAATGRYRRFSPSWHSIARDL
jgi:glycosyltransferase involved in cell wall biosynthesis